MNPYMNQYQNTLVNTSSPEKILIMLYEGAIRFISQADEAMASGDKPTKAQKISKAVAIISELSNTLNYEVGGTIAEDLDYLYSFIICELIKVNVNENREPLGVVKTILSELRAAWIKAIENKNAKKKDEDGENTADKENTFSESTDYKSLNTAAL